MPLAEVILMISENTQWHYSITVEVVTFVSVRTLVVNLNSGQICCFFIQDFRLCSIDVFFYFRAKLISRKNRTN